MAKSKKSAASGGVEDYRFRTAKRKNNPPAAIASAAPVPVIPKAKYEYNPHLPPVLRFDQTGRADVLETRLSVSAEARVAEFLGFTAARALTSAEREELSALITQAAHARVAAEPWLEWTGKREKKSFEVDPVALHIHERISAQAILKVAARQDVQRGLFADPQQDYHEAVQFYKHNIDWSNRLILGDSLSVMSSLAKREDLAGKVQMIYIDPPYGIKFASNFQPEIGKRDVKDKEQDLTREPEMVRAYRDTWNLGIHSYLSYLRDRLVAARELLADSGSIFVQINDENLHRVRTLMDECFSESNFVSLISYATTSGVPGLTLATSGDYLLWFAKDATQLKYRQLYRDKRPGEQVASEYKWLFLSNGETRNLTEDEYAGAAEPPDGARLWRFGPLRNHLKTVYPPVSRYSRRYQSVAQASWTAAR
jgi:adenine-specific DNA-methyltransferase